MSNYNLSANMSLPIPVAGVDPGPDWALNIDACLALLDAHDHTSGNGVQITPAGMNINSDLNFNINNAIGVKSVRFSAQSALAATSPNLTCVYVIGADLYYNDANGNQVRITQSGSVAGASGTITGLPSGTASAAYNAISGTFIFQSASSTAANIDGGSIIIREVAASAKGITISSPSALAANYALTLPGSLPSAQKFMTLDNAGNIAASWAVDNSTLEVNANSVRVKDLGITAAKIADATITGTQLSSNINLPGNLSTAGSKSLVVSNTNPSSKNLAIIQGRFDQTTVLSGEGFSVGNPSPGLYNVSFTTSFGSVPSIQATCENGGARIATITNVAVSGCTINTFDTAFAPVQTPVNLLVIGQKA